MLARVKPQPPTGFSSGLYGGSRTGVRLPGTTSALATWYPARSHTSTTCLPGGAVADSWSRNVCAAPAFSRPAPGRPARPVAGQAAVGTRRLAYAACLGAVGRLPSRAQAVVSAPFWPKRASPSSRASTSSPGCAASASATAEGNFF